MHNTSLPKKLNPFGFTFTTISPNPVSSVVMLKVNGNSDLINDGILNCASTAISAVKVNKIRKSCIVKTLGTESSWSNEPPFYTIGFQRSNKRI